MTFARATIAGAGLAGLSAAVRLAEAGVRVRIADSAAQAGGRCRSYYDRQLGLTIDNGNHLVLAGNEAVARFRTTIADGEGLMRSLRGRLTGIAQPTWVLDIPGGHGKVPLGPQWIEKTSDGEGTGWNVRDPDGRDHRYDE